MSAYFLIRCQLISLLGVSLGWICLHHQPGPSACLRSSPHGTFLPQVRTYNESSWTVIYACTLCSNMVLMCATLTVAVSHRWKSMHSFLASILSQLSITHDLGCGDSPTNRTEVKDDFFLSSKHVWLYANRI